MLPTKQYTIAGLFYSGMRRMYRILTILVFSAILWGNGSYAQSFDIAVNSHGISFGNSRQFTGLRFNLMDNDVERVTGVNITFYKAHDNNKNAVVKGVSLSG